MEHALAYVLRKERERLKEIEAELAFARSLAEAFSRSKVLQREAYIEDLARIRELFRGALADELAAQPHTFWGHLRAAFQCLLDRLDEEAERGRI